jgi:glutathione S-transferase
MLKLHGFRISNYHNKVRIMLLEKGIEHEEDAGAWPSQKEEFLVRTPMGKVPWLELDDGRRLAESSVIAEYLEAAYTAKPLLPKDPYQRAKTLEVLLFLELYVELVARRLYMYVFLKKDLPQGLKDEVEKELGRGVRAFRALARFDPYVAGPQLTLADCGAFVHLQIVSAATKLAYGRDFLAEIPQVKPYLEMLGKRPVFEKIMAERREATEAAKAGKK